MVYYTHLIFLVIKAVLKDTMNLFVYSFLKVSISMNIPSKISLILKFGVTYF
ncbi:truncated transposase [Lactobacillus johnsonii DPC 6026]|nr:truncated transposase [Lactobacillus johnsonii DPC 6026]